VDGDIAEAVLVFQDISYRKNRRGTPGPGRIHYLEAGVVQSSHGCLGLRVLDHDAANIDADDLYGRKGGGHFVYPSARPTGNIQGVSDVDKIGAFC
jgi:hypothetical protein